MYHNQVKTVITKTKGGAVITRTTVLNGVVTVEKEVLKGEKREDLIAAYIAARPWVAQLISPAPEGGWGT
jgi:hypothetical protein